LSSRVQLKIRRDWRLAVEEEERLRLEGEARRKMADRLLLLLVSGMEE
jgi:hypothetical protein